MQDPQACAALGLNRQSRLLFIGSEADTDPALYAELVGRSADAVRAGAAA
jgi:diaminopropionate ammonia-lyase